MTKKRLCYCQCPDHGFACISIDDDSGGTRVTGGKCCGRWITVKEFPMTANDWLELARLAEEAAEDL
jgi:hypothetical protein